MKLQRSHMATSHAKAADVDMPRSSSLDVMKCLAAFCVVWIHYGTGWLSPFVRWAVPLFFIITGFYYPPMIERGRFWTHIKKLIAMLLCASMLYACWTLQHEIRHDTLGQWIANNVRIRHIIWLLATDNDMFGFHLWYFYAVIYNLVLFRIIDKLHLTKYAKLAVPILLLIFLVGNFTPWYPRFRNFLFFGFPCMMIGRWIREREDQPFSFLGAPSLLVTISSVSLLMAYAEMYILNTMYHDRGLRDMFIFTIPMILPFFYWALRHPTFGLRSIFADIGRKHSANIYILHVLAGSLLGHLIEFNTSYILKAMRPFLIFLLSFLMSYILVRTWRRIRRRKT